MFPTGARNPAASGEVRRIHRRPTRHVERWPSGLPARPWPRLAEPRRPRDPPDTPPERRFWPRQVSWLTDRRPARPSRCVASVTVIGSGSPLTVAGAASASPIGARPNSLLAHDPSTVRTLDGRTFHGDDCNVNGFAQLRNNVTFAVAEGPRFRAGRRRTPARGGGTGHDLGTPSRRDALQDCRHHRVHAHVEVHVLGAVAPRLPGTGQRTSR